uniref:Putative ovule protein n=1 Tax=Solanum chacoense TaxID=4108 RepID=A0A0V0IYM2_SOLCH
MLLGHFKNGIGCVVDTSKVVQLWRIRHGCGNISGESEQLSSKLVRHFRRSVEINCVGVKDFIRDERK